MKRLFLLITAASLIVSSHAQSASEVMQQMAESELLNTSLFGVYARTSDGQVLLERNSRTKMQPASNMKLITTGCALTRLGPDFRFETRLAHSGTVKNGVLKGDLYIVGGGDPTLGAPDSIATPKNELFETWKKILSDAGILRIAGRIIGDGRFLPGEDGRNSWSFSEYGGNYSTGMNGLCFRKNAIKFKISPTEEGSALDAEMLEPVLPWLPVDVLAKTGKNGSRRAVYAYANDMAPAIQIRGGIPVGGKPVNASFANKYGAMTAAAEFCSYLVSRGVKVKGGFADIDRHGLVRDASFKTHEPAAAQSGLTIIGSTYSPVLSRIARETNHRSDNFYAEALLRALAVRGGEDSYRKGWAEERAILSGLGVDVNNRIRIDDGSGVSKLNYVSPEFFVDYLQAMQTSPSYGAFLASLPSPGSNGTMKPLLKDEPAELKARIKLKSGGIAGVCCYSGYIFPAEEGGKTVYFSIMTGNSTSARSAVRVEIMKLIAALAHEN